MQSRREALNIIARWEERLLTPSEKAEQPCCWCGNPIDKRYIIGHKDFCEDCAKSLHEMVVLDEPCECDGCGGCLEEKYYSVYDDIYCEKCFKKFFRED